jgi:hypothetical protein
MCLNVSGSYSEPLSQGLDRCVDVAMFVARVAVLIARVTVTHYERLEFPVGGANVRNAAKSGQGGDDPLDPCLVAN